MVICHHNSYASEQRNRVILYVTVAHSILLSNEEYKTYSFTFVAHNIHYCVGHIYRYYFGQYTICLVSLGGIKTSTKFVYHGLDNRAGKIHFVGLGATILFYTYYTWIYLSNHNNYKNKECNVPTIHTFLCSTNMLRSWLGVCTVSFAFYAICGDDDGSSQHKYILQRNFNRK